MCRFKLVNVDLRLFDGTAGGAAATSGDGVAETGQISTETTAENKRNGNGHRSSGELSNVVYGKQDNPVAEGENDITTTSNTLENKRAEFEELINGEYKDMFTDRMQSIIDRRFKETKNLESRLMAQQPVIDTLMSKYKIGDGDIGKLTEAINNDDAYWEEAAEEAGLTVEQYKAVQKLRRENEEFKRAQRMQAGQQQMNAQINDWYKQAEAVKTVYPDFDFKTEVANRDFLGMLKAGIPVQKAYEVAHFDDLVTGAARTAAQTAEKNTVAKLRNKASRPMENGTSSSSSAVIKSDVSTLTKADRAEIARRAARGETIRF